MAEAEKTRYEGWLTDPTTSEQQKLQIAFTCVRYVLDLAHAGERIPTERNISAFLSLGWLLASASRGVRGE